jgi:hypothetical protein
LSTREKLERVVPAEVVDFWVWDGEFGVLWWREHPGVGEAEVIGDGWEVCMRGLRGFERGIYHFRENYENFFQSYSLAYLYMMNSSAFYLLDQG